MTATVAALARLGAAGAICNSSGFAESDAAGVVRQAALVAAAAGMPVIGPICPGFGNYFDRAVFLMDHFDTHAPARGVAVISNGGAYLSDLGCADRSLPIGYMVGMGNQAVVSMAEMLEAVLDDPRVCAVNLYFEGLGDIARLSRAAALAARKGVPVVAVKGGRTASGTRAAQSHTASLSGSAAIASAVFRRFGWIEAHTPSEAIETLKMFCCTALPQGRRTAFITSSGSYAVLGADLAEREGLQLAPPSRAVAARIAPLLPDFVGPANPLDISTGQTSEVAPLQGLEDGMRAVGHAARYGARRSVLDDRHAQMVLPDPVAVAGAGLAVDEAQAKSMLAACGLPVPDSCVLSGDASAAAALRVPVALKALVDGLMHKSEAGAVALGIGDSADLPAAIAAMQQRLAPHGIVAQRFLVEEVVADGVAELLVGLRREPGIGLVLTLAVGGIHVELLRDTATLLLPATREAIGAGLQGLRLYPLLTGWRGQPAVSLDAALDSIEGLARFCTRHPTVSELEINPLILTPQGAWIADAVLRIDTTTRGTHSHHAELTEEQ